MVGVDRDPVLGAPQQSLLGLRPVLFHPPYEAAVWSVLALRRHRSQAAAIRTRLATTYGRTLLIDGEALSASPLPEKLLQVEAVAGLDPTRISRLHAVARDASPPMRTTRTMIEIKFRCFEDLAPAPEGAPGYAPRPGGGPGGWGGWVKKRGQGAATQHLRAVAAVRRAAPHRRSVWRGEHG